jgi:hypothetical protein
MIKSKIDHLSLSEDDRQDLWVAYLENPGLDLSVSLDNIYFKNKIQEKIINNINNITLAYLVSDSDNEISTLLDNFTELEQSVLRLFMVGLSHDQVSRYKGIERMYLQQMLYNISRHPIWENFLVKKTTNNR